MRWWKAGMERSGVGGDFELPNRIPNAAHSVFAHDGNQSGST
jgi:hypothetical protein